MPYVKYIKTNENEIVVFSELQQHSEFKRFNPVSAGFIIIGVNSEGDVDCRCHGESVSLNLKSDSDVDTALARKQILGRECW